MGGGGGPPVEYYHSDLGFRTYGAENPSVAVTGSLPSRPDGSGSVLFASFNIRSGQNGGLEGALRWTRWELILGSFWKQN